MVRKVLPGDFTIAAVTREEPAAAPCALALEPEHDERLPTATARGITHPTRKNVFSIVLLHSLIETLSIGQRFWLCWISPGAAGFTCFTASRNFSSEKSGEPHNSIIRCSSFT